MRFSERLSNDLQNDVVGISDRDCGSGFALIVLQVSTNHPDGLLQSWDIR